jgi:acid stress-induced BolA-like protein IbaG/YrbA
VKIEKQVETCVDVEVHISLEDIACAIAEDTHALSTVLYGINNAHTFFKAIPDEIIAQMNVKQKRTIYEAMLLQINRYSDNGGEGQS